MLPSRKRLLVVPLVWGVAVLGVVVARGQPNAGGDGPANEVAADRSLVIARFEGGGITLGDMQSAVDNKAPLVRKEIAAPGGRERFLRELVRWDLLVLEAVRRGYERDQQVLDAVGLAANDVMVERDLALDPTAISASEVERRFLETRADRPPVRRGSHIQVATEAEARDILRDVSAESPEHFARVAVERSTDARTNAQGGELGYVRRDGLNVEGQAVDGVPGELLTALFAIAHVGDVAAAPIRHAGGFSVLLFSGQMPARVTRLADVEDRIRAELAGRKQAQALDALAAKLQGEIKPVVHPELLDLIVVDTKAPDILSGFPAAPDDPRLPTAMMEPDGA